MFKKGSDRESDASTDWLNAWSGSKRWSGEVGVSHSRRETQHSDYGFLSHLCNFVVPFIRKEPALQGIREERANERSNHVREERTLRRPRLKRLHRLVRHSKLDSRNQKSDALNPI